MSATDELLDRLTQTQQAFLASVIRHEVDFVVVGGFAVMFYTNPGYDRHLDDLDVFVDVSPENLGRLQEALRPLGVKQLEELSSSARPNVKIVWHDAEALTSMTGLTFIDVAARACLFSLKGKNVRVISRADLVRAKELASQDPDRHAKGIVDVRDLIELTANPQGPAEIAPVRTPQDD